MEATRPVEGMRGEGTPLDGTVLEVLPSCLFRVKLADGRVVTAHVAAKLRLHVVRIIPGDRVSIAVSPRDASRGRILQRS